MRVLFLATRLDRPSARYRALSYLPLFRTHGVHARALAIQDRDEPGAEVRSLAVDADVVVLLRALLSPKALADLRRLSRVLVYDFDDAVLLRESSRSWRWSPRRLLAFRRTLRVADRVLAGNEALRRWAGVFGAWERCWIQPTPVGGELLALPTASSRSPEEPVVLGWVGSRGTLAYLEALRPVLRRVLARNPRVRFRVVCDQFPDWPEIPVEKLCWRADDEATFFSVIDIGVMPLSGDLWARGKGAYKMWQYLAAAKPAVASRVGEAARVARECSGVLAVSSTREWVCALDRLIHDPQQRRVMGAAGREYAAARANPADCCALFLRRLSLLVNGTPMPPPR